MADKKMYKVGITVKEPWSADISYEVLDITLYAVENGGDGCSYIAIRANQGVTPGTDDTVWVKATQRGQSIYDLAVKYGDFEGTEAEFEAEYEAAVHAAQSAAQSASDIEAQVETNEAARVTAERARSDAETARSSAETARINAENARDDAESLRDTAESDRVRAEAGRVTAEASRVEAETFRQGAEQSRRQQFEGLKTDMETAIDNVDAKSAEIAEDIEGYEANEAARVSAEQSRVSAESSRVSAESARATAETARQTAEGNRATAETERASAEGARTTAEQGRVSAEQGRVSAESGRATAESARVAAETARESASATAVQNAETATAAANTAAEHAEEAATTIDEKIAGKADQSEVSQLEHEVDGLFENSDADFDIADENGNILARFSSGEFEVKKFNSAKTPQEGDSTADFSIVDENGFPVVVFRGGHIKTKYFNSLNQLFSGKKLSIMGDSISTAINHNAVEFTVLDSDISQGRTLQGYPTYYDIGTTIGGVEVTSGMVGVLTSFSPVAGDEGKTIGKPQNYNTAGTSGVSSYTETWWYKMATALGMEVLQNVSWSGASISSHEGNANDYKTSYAWHPAQINKLATRDAGGNTIKPDVVIIYRGTNDMTHSPYTSLTDFGADAMSIPDTDYSDSSYDFKVAYCMTIKKIREAYPQAKIFICTLNAFKRVNYSQFPTNNGYNTLPEYNNAIREIANMMGCGLIELDKDGITFENCYPTFISDSSTIPTHPNPVGHTKMAEKAIIDIQK